MNGFRDQDHEQVIKQMTHVILTEMLERVLREFQKTTGTRIGAIHVRPEEPNGRRRVEIEIQHADGDSIEALMRYKKILCEHETFMDEAFCGLSSGEVGNDH
jgi:hypothetical protein